MKGLPKKRRLYMALTRKFLAAMGIETDKVDEIISAHVETVDGLKAERDSLKDKAEKYDAEKKKADDLQAKVTDLEKKVEGKDPFEDKYNALKDEYDKYKNSIETEKTNASKTKAYKQMLKEVGISEKRLDAVMKVTDLSNIKLAQDGTIEGVDDLKTKVADEWADFIEKSATKGADVKKPPVNNGGAAKTKEDILKIEDANERQAAIAENLELFE